MAIHTPPTGLPIQWTSNTPLIVDPGPPEISFFDTVTATCPACGTTYRASGYDGAQAEQRALDWRTQHAERCPEKSR